MGKDGSARRRRDKLAGTRDFLYLYHALSMHIHVHLSVGARCLNFKMSFPKFLYFVYASREGHDYTVLSEPWLLASKSCVQS